ANVAGSAGAGSNIVFTALVGAPLACTQLAGAEGTDDLCVDFSSIDSPVDGPYAACGARGAPAGRAPRVHDAPHSAKSRGGRSVSVHLRGVSLRGRRGRTDPLHGTRTRL